MGNDNRYPLLLKEIEHKSEAGFDLNGKRRLVEEESQGRDTGRPSQYYNYDDMRPLPVVGYWKKKGKVWDTSLVGAAYENKSIEDMHRIGKHGLSQFQFLVLVLIALTLILAGAGLYFAYNDYCALHSCASGNGGIRIA